MYLFCPLILCYNKGTIEYIEYIKYRYIYKNTYINGFYKEYRQLKKGYIKLILAIILGIAVISGGIYCAYHFLSNKSTTILYRSTIEDKINALRPYIEAADTFNMNSVAYTYQLQPTLEELRNHSHNTTVTLPNYKELKSQLEAAKQESSTPYEDVNKATDELLAILTQLIPVSEQIQNYYTDRTFEKDNYVGSDNLANQYVPLADQFNAAYNAFDLTLENRNNELYSERMKEFAKENRVNAVNFIELNILLSQTVDIIDPDGNTDTQKVETNLQDITKRINALQPGTKPETQTAVKLYQDAVKEFIAEARNYIIINSSYGEAYTQLYVKYNRMISRANEVDMNDLDAVDSKK